MNWQTFLRTYPRSMLKFGTWLVLHSSDDGEVFWYSGSGRQNGSLTWSALGQDEVGLSLSWVYAWHEEG